MLGGCRVGSHLFTALFGFQILPPSPGPSHTCTYPSLDSNPPISGLASQWRPPSRLSRTHTLDTLPSGHRVSAAAASVRVV
jgi:hypothetical protein